VVTCRIDVVGEVDQRRGAAEERLDPPRPGQELRRPYDHPGKSGRQRCGAEQAQLRLIEAGSRECEALVAGVWHNEQIGEPGRHFTAYTH
jgi:hypothetical protein